MREALPSGHLKSSVQGPGDGDTFGRLGSTGGDGGYQRVQLVSLLLQLLYQGLYGALAEGFALSALPGVSLKLGEREMRTGHLPVTHQTVHDGEAGVR